MSDMKKLIEAVDKFAGQAVGQKPGDQVRGTDKATPKKSGKHPFAGRLVGASESKSLLADLEKELVEGAVKRGLAEEFASFKESRVAYDKKTGQMGVDNEDPDQRHGLYINGKLVKTVNSADAANNLKKRDPRFKDATVKKIAEAVSPQATTQLVPRRAPAQPAAAQPAVQTPAPPKLGTPPATPAPAAKPAAAAQPAAQAPAAPQQPAQQPAVDPIKQRADQMQQSMLDRMGARFGLPAGSSMEQVQAAQQAHLDKNDPAAAAQFKQNMTNIDNDNTAANKPVQLAPKPAAAPVAPDADHTGGVAAAKANKSPIAIMLAQPTIANNQQLLDVIAPTVGLPAGSTVQQILAADDARNAKSGGKYAAGAQPVAESSLNEFAPGNGGGESGRWYTDDQMTDIVGDGWWQDLDLSGASLGIPDGDVPKEYLIREAQAWLDDQGYNVQVLNVNVDDDNCDWYIEGNFGNPNFASRGMHEGLTPAGQFLSKAERVKAGDMVYYKGKCVGTATGKVKNNQIEFKLAPGEISSDMSGLALLPIDDISLREGKTKFTDLERAIMEGGNSLEELNPADAVTLDIPLFIRLLEYAREDAKTDMDLHNVAENAIKLSAGGNVLSMDNYESIIPSDAVDEDVESFGYKRLHPEIFKARQQFPHAKSDMEALLMYVQSQEEKDINRVDRVNDREDAEIDQLDREEDSLEAQVDALYAQLDKLKAQTKTVKEEVPAPVATAGGPAGANQPKTPPGVTPKVDPAQQALLKQNQSKLQQNLANLKSAGVQIDPAKAAQSLQKTDTGAPMNAMDKDNIAAMAPAIGNVMANPSTASQLNTLIKKAGGGA